MGIITSTKLYFSKFRYEGRDSARQLRPTRVRPCNHHASSGAKSPNGSNIKITCVNPYCFPFTCYIIRVKYPAQNRVRNVAITGKLLCTFLVTVINIINFQNPHMTFLFVCLFWHDSPPVGQGLLIHEVSRSHTTTHHSQ